MCNRAEEQEQNRYVSTVSGGVDAVGDGGSRGNGRVSSKLTDETPVGFYCPVHGPVFVATWPSRIYYPMPNCTEYYDDGWVKPEKVHEQ